MKLCLFKPNSFIPLCLIGSTHFSWNYDACMGQLDSSCARGELPITCSTSLCLCYPSLILPWKQHCGIQIGMVTILNAKGMVTNLFIWQQTPHVSFFVYIFSEPVLNFQHDLSSFLMIACIVYLFTSKADCCNEHYSWNQGCMGSSSGTSSQKFYADWLGDDTCKNDGKAPTYMVLNPSVWLYETLSDCCKSIFKVAPTEHCYHRRQLMFVFFSTCSQVPWTSIGKWLTAWALAVRLITILIGLAVTKDASMMAMSLDTCCTIHHYGCKRLLQPAVRNIIHIIWQRAPDPHQLDQLSFTWTGKQISVYKIVRERLRVED